MRGVFLGTMLGYIAVFVACVELLRRSRWAAMAADAQSRSEMPTKKLTEPDVEMENSAEQPSA
jgi:hypothetical protein